MFSNLQINRTLVKNEVRMEVPKKTVSEEAMQKEWAVIRAAQDDPAMFRPLYDRYFECIFRFIFRRTANENLASDICSQVFLKAMQQIKKYQFKGVPFSAWLYRIASNEIAQHYRNTHKNRVISLETSQLGDLVAEMDSNQKESYQNALIQALDELKETDVQLIEMRFFEQRPFKEIADIVGITESNAKVKTYRILEKLKKIILQIHAKGSRAPEL
jgi:RNA polymerase sigma-70 factor (ECF subfamily)